MFEIMTEARVFVEIAYAKLFNVVEKKMGGNFTYLWNNRGSAFNLFNENIYGMHPIKTRAFEKDKAGRKK